MGVSHYHSERQIFPIMRVGGKEFQLVTVTNAFGRWVIAASRFWVFGIPCFPVCVSVFIEIQDSYGSEKK